jgi:hypothetical protein
LQSPVRLILAIILLLVVVPSMGQSTSPLDSALEDNVYTNFFFRIRYPFSASWIPQSVAAIDQIQTATQGCAGGNAVGASGSAKRSHNLLTLARNIPGQGLAGRSRAIIVFKAEELASDSGISSGQDCAARLAERLKKDRFTAVGDAKEVQLSGVSFVRQDFKGTSSAGSPLYESAFFTVSKGYAVGFILVAPNEQMRGLMLETLGKLTIF